MTDPLCGDSVFETFGLSAGPATSGPVGLPFRFAPRPDLTSVEVTRLYPFVGRGEPLMEVDYYTMGSEARHLLVGRALREVTRRS